MKKVVRLPLRFDSRKNESISLADLDDDTLMVMTRSGEECAFDVLVCRHQRMVLCVARKYLGDPLYAEDAAQNAFLDLYRHTQSYRPEGKLRAFLTKIVINQCRMTRRRMTSEAKTLLAFAAQSTMDTLDTPNAYTTEQQRLLDRAVCALRPKLREVVVLRYAAGFSYQEISETLGIRPGTVKSRIFSAIARLGASLEAYEK
ncbi:MAG: sigma-70 family RNA polymerase sigma factor [Deltaproteobacteria bacterium]|nr:sigma-70 family RNA polymerase sigma factor [Deltaproteobacteria bacterium]